MIKASGNIDGLLINPPDSISDNPGDLPTTVDLAPDVNIIDLQLQQFVQRNNHFKNTNQLITKSNHVNGVVEQISINEGKFHEQYHNFENFGYAQNPSDNAGIADGGR